LWVLGRSAALIVALESLIGWLLVEWLMGDWRRIPFTCSYIPGKGFVPLMFVKGFASYLIFTTLATILMRASLAVPAVSLVASVVVGATAGALCLQRTRYARLAPLMFDDELPTDVSPLRLNPE
jgi:hypothetical protein